MDTLVAGSYDRFLFGLQCSTSESAEALRLKRAFTYPAHKGPVKCVAAAAPFLASGGADDLIHLYDLQAGADLGFLMSPGDGAVSALAFYCRSSTSAPTHLFSGAADGTISVWQAGGEWVCLKTLRGHKKEVTSISVHPSGRVALSTSRDGTLRLWNLVKGKCAHTLGLDYPADQVVFSPDGSSYGIVTPSKVEVHDVDSIGPPRLSLPHARRPQCLAFCSNTTLLTGAEDGSIRLWNTERGNEPALVVPRAHASRVRAAIPLSGASAEGPALVGSASSDGVVRIWDLQKLAAQAAESGIVEIGAVPIAEVSTQARLTCLCSLNPASASASSASMGEAKSAPAAKAAGAARQGMGKAAKKLATSAEAKQSGKKRKELEPHASKKAAVQGVAHDGVVDFPDAHASDRQTTTKKKKKNKSKASSGGVTPGLSNSQGKGEMVMQVKHREASMAVKDAGVRKMGQATKGELLGKLGTGVKVIGKKMRGRI